MKASLGSRAVPLGAGRDGRPTSPSTFSVNCSSACWHRSHCWTWTDTACSSPPSSPSASNRSSCSGSGQGSMVVIRELRSAPVVQHDVLIRDRHARSLQFANGGDDALGCHVAGGVVLLANDQDA